jgi:hypothetical protein
MNNPDARAQISRPGTSNVHHVCGYNPLIYLRVAAFVFAGAQPRREHEDGGSENR